MKSVFSKLALASVLCVSLGYAADYSKQSDSDLIKLNNGKLKAADAADLKLEIMKRANKLEGDAKKDFFEKLKASYEKATDSWKAKDLRAYEAEVKKAFKEKVQSLSDEAKAELGLGGHGASCPNHQEGAADKNAGHKH